MVTTSSSWVEDSAYGFNFVEDWNFSRIIFFGLLNVQYCRLDMRTHFSAASTRHTSKLATYCILPHLA